MSYPTIILVGAVLAYTVVAAVVDWRAKRLPNALTVPFFAAGLAFHFTSGAVRGGIAAGLAELLRNALAGFGVGFGLMFVLWLVGKGGGGDVKYMGALGAWMGPQLTVYAFVVAALLSILGSFLVLVFEAVRLGLGPAKRRYVSPAASAAKGDAEETENARQRALVKRRLMPWAVPAGIAAWMVVLTDTFLVATQ